MGRKSIWPIWRNTALARFTVSPFDRSLSSPWISETTNDGKRLSNREIGDLGEKLAALFLRREGCKVLYRNFRAPRGGEVDLVCRDGEILVFVEVKTRTSDRSGRPVLAVDSEKQQLIARGATEWLRLLHFPEINFRFDVVEVGLRKGEIPAMNRVVGAFSLPEGQLYPHRKS